MVCRELFYLNSTDYNCHSCSNIDLNCYTCQSTSAICTSCVEGYILVDNKCVLIGTCGIANCIACHINATASTKCLLCGSGYSIANSNLTCNRIACPGEQFLVGSFCTCGLAAYLWNNKCLSCSINCLACNAQICMICRNGYYPSGTSCIKCSLNCESCTASSCFACDDAFFLHNGSCIRQKDSKVAVSVASDGSIISCPAGCKTCDLSTAGSRICVTPNDGYALIGRSLIKCEVSCKTCSG